MCHKHINIPIFIPQLACGFHCVFCNQRNISGHQDTPEDSKIIATIEKYLSTIKAENSITEIAFFGGSFTGLPITQQKHFFELTKPYLSSGQVKGIRLSTRADYINIEILELLKGYNVSTIELGVQSTNNEVLKASGRGHTREDVFQAALLIKKHGFLLGLQMMLGLPYDNMERANRTAKDIVEMGADSTRIYPTLVIKNTELENLYYKNKYSPITLEEAVLQAKDVYKIFEVSGVKVLRMGLHSSEGLISGETLIAGPFHVSFGELVYTELWKEELLPLMKKYENKKIQIIVSPTQISYVVGYESKNKLLLQKFYKEVFFSTDNSIKGRNYNVNYC
jgi:histone acetyltransferase (RNA polymerase elongator complex component)